MYSTRRTPSRPRPGTTAGDPSRPPRVNTRPRQPRPPPDGGEIAAVVPERDEERSARAAPGRRADAGDGSGAGQRLSHARAPERRQPAPVLVTRRQGHERGPPGLEPELREQAGTLGGHPPEILQRRVEPRNPPR